MDQEGGGGVKVWETLEIVGLRETRTTSMTRVEMFQKILDEAFAGWALALWDSEDQD
ncbi:hypothetical protein QJS10_CPA07g00662 [Acorus calamus]|uniref:Uncharacterized protein n=1 Tax=Acorus calamus TaxID=4465 RepID=A0AAV9EEF1_ACOCL|nr:hypothetical protein QJS10_CPA07g00662 [Acorus calamus]